MSAKPIICISFVLVSLLGTFLFVGIKHDPEFSWETTTFIKYKPTFQLHFYDRSYGDLHNEETATESDRYSEFVNKHHIWYFSFLLIQLTMTLLLMGSVAFWKNKSPSIRGLLLHFLICVMPCAISLGFYLHKDYWVVLTTLLINLIAAKMLFQGNKSGERSTSVQECDATEVK